MKTLLRALLTRENLLAVLLAALFTLLTVFASKSPSSWIYQGF